MSHPIEAFAEAANRYCAWAEGPAQAAEAEAITALHLLSDLYQRALSLPAAFVDSDPEWVSDSEWKSMFKRFGALPFNYYAARVEPMDITSDGPEIGDLADDLADIWRDLRRGLWLFNAGHIEAAGWEWRQHFWIHWGRHAASGMYALHCWLAEHSESAL